MDSVDHIAAATEHMKLAVAKFRKDNGGVTVTAHYFPLVVRQMLRLESLNKKIRRSCCPHRDKETPQ